MYYGRVTRMEGSPEQIDAGVAFVRDTIVPAAKQIEGFRGILSLTDRASGTGLTVTFWDSEEAMRASEEQADSMRAEAAEALSGTIAGVERYEVTISEMPAAVGT